MYMLVFAVVKQGDLAGALTPHAGGDSLRVDVPFLRSLAPMLPGPTCLAYLTHFTC